MNTLKTDILGGFPWVLDDFRWHHDAVADALTAIVKGLNLNGALGGGDNCRIQGVNVTPNGANWDFNDGYLLVDGEVVRLDLQTLPDTDTGFDFYHVTIAETFDPAGLKSLEDGGTANAYKKRRAIINTGNFPVTTEKVITIAGAGSSEMFPYLYATIANSNTNFETAWSSISAATLDALGHTSITAITSGAIRYKKVGRVLFVDWKLTINLTGAVDYFEITVPSVIAHANDYQGVGMASMSNAGGVNEKMAIVRYLTGNVFGFNALDGAYNFSGTTAELSFTTTYRVAP